MFNFPGRILIGVVVLIVVASHASAQAAGQDEVMRTCESALTKATFDEATAAGLNPTASPVSFDSRKAVATRRNGKVLKVRTGPVGLWHLRFLQGVRGDLAG